MVTKITFPKRIEAALNYNEKKVQKAKAVCLLAGNFLHEATDLNFYQKLEGFNRLNELNERATIKTLHVSLNFSPAEKLSDINLVNIASDYMTKIGFAGQPYLVYKHQDAGHPHIHIVSTTIQEDGSRINTHNIGRNQSEKARKEIEKIYGLVKAEQQTKTVSQKIRPVEIEKASYGKHETKQTISNIVSVVFNQYKFASLPEFNAALKQFNVVAERGKEEGRIYKKGGLVYRILDENGNKVGVPIKASSLWCKPILKNLEIKFLENGNLKQSLKPKTKKILDDCLTKNPYSLRQFMTDLEQKQIHTVLRQNPAGRIYGITFVDIKSKCVFNGSDLGKGYSATSLERQFNSSQEIGANPNLSPINLSDKNQKDSGINKSFQKDNSNPATTTNLMEGLLEPEYPNNNNDALNLLKKRRENVSNVIHIYNN
ncbi:MAG: relaxase/mobilization nuclease domain-containing protein [Ginsengibacter sp.]